MAESSTVDSTVSTVEDIDNESEQDYSDVEAEPPKKKAKFYKQKYNTLWEKDPNGYLLSGIPLTKHIVNYVTKN